MKQCIGFGEFEGECQILMKNNLYWCLRCDDLRKTHISAQLAKIEADLKSQQPNERLA